MNLDSQTPLSGKNASLRTIRLAAAVLALIALPCERLIAHDPNQDRGEGEPDFAQRENRVNYLRQHKMSEGLRQNAILKVQRAALEAAGASPNEIAGRLFGGGPNRAFPFTASPELRSKGTVRTLTVLADFNDHRAGTHLPGPADFHANIYGAGTPMAQQYIPYESMNAYYKRASGGLVDVQGDVLDWHHFAKDRESYEPAIAPLGPDQEYRQMYLDNEALFNMAVEILSARDATHNFAQYDNDNDGDIDLLTILYAGPPGAWNSFWWAYRWEFQTVEASTTRFDGKRLKQFVFQFIDTRPNSNDFNPTTLIHEMGHAFGLADYYDYKPEIGPPGGVGGLDMMHGNWGNHSAFSRWLLDWIDPIIIGDGAPAPKDLLASGATGGSAPQAIAIFPGLTDSNAPSEEMFIIENRHQVGNDGHTANTPASGLLVWHVDATVNFAANDFAFDNSYTDHKLIRLVRADTPNDFADNEVADAGTYFTIGKEFTASSTPSSARLDGSPSHVSLTAISAPGDIVAASIGIDTLEAPPVLAAAPGEPIPDAAASEASALSAPTASEARTAATSETRGAAVSEAKTEAASVDLDELTALDDRLASATSEQIASLWKSAEYASDGGVDVDEAALSRQMILTRWAAKDGEAAAQALLAIPDKEFVRRVYPAVMQAWVNNDVASAAKWFFSAEREKLRAAVLLKTGKDTAKALFSHVALIDQDKAVSRLDVLNEVPEIYGALLGLRQAEALKGSDAGELESGYRDLNKNKAVVQKLETFRKAMKEIDLESLDNAGQRDRLKAFFRGIMPD